MVKMQAVQSALAIRRQRSRREEAKKAKERRASKASNLSTPRHSVVSLDGRVYFDEGKESKHLFGQVTMFHVGGVLILIGLMLVITALMPQYVKSTSLERRNDLLGTGCFFIFLGGILTTISRFVSNSEEEELNQYIKGRLSRSRSGHRLVKDVEGQTPSRERRSKPVENGINSSPAKSPTNKALPNGKLSCDSSEQSTSKDSTSELTGAFTEVVNPDYIAVGVDSPIPMSTSTELVLSRILEEDEELETDVGTEVLDSTPESSLTPTSPLETKGLLDKHHSPKSSSKSSVKSSCKSLKLSS